MTYFLDTNICIFHIKGLSPKVREAIIGSLDNIKIPVMVAAELLYGVEKSGRRDENRKRYEEFMSYFITVPFDDSAAEHYASIRAGLEKKGTPIGDNDMIIAAIVRANNGVLITNNTKEFSRVPGLNIEDWTS